MKITVKKILRILNSRIKKEYLYQKDHIIKFIYGSKTLPEFLIIGAQKAGTSALYYYLSQHSELQSSYKKEVRFFSSKDYYKGLNYYQKQFPAKSIQKVYFEATPEYLWSKQAPERIYQFNSAIKLIIILRDPIKRAHSAWNMFKEFNESDQKLSIISSARRKSEGEKARLDEYIELLTNPEYPSFDDWVHKECEKIKNNENLSPNFIARGIYYKQIERVLKFFNRDQILIIENKELRSEKEITLNKVCNFLGISKFDFKNANLTDIGVRKYIEPISEDTKRYLTDFYKPYNEKLYHLIEKRYNW